MSLVTVDPTLVLPSLAPQFWNRALSAGSVIAGQPVYAIADGYIATAAVAAAGVPTAVVIGIALNSAEDEQAVMYISEDPDFAPGFAATAGQIYILANTAGRIATASDLSTGWLPNVIYIGKSGGNVILQITTGPNVKV